MDCNVHRMFYLNIKLLNMIVPIGSSLSGLLNQKMFKEVNITGFFAVMHYLLNILDPQYFNSNFVWPTLNKKDELKFKSEVIKFVNNVVKNSDFNIVPTVKPSMLVAPGGPQISYFMWRFSLYVLRETLKKKHSIDVDYVPCYLIPSAVMAAKMKIAFRVPLLSLHKKVNIEAKDHQMFVHKALIESRKLLAALEYVGELNKMAELQLESLINSVKTVPVFEKRYKQNRLDDAIEDWGHSIESDFKDLESDVLTVQDFSNSVNDVYQMVKELNEPSKQIVLDGSAIKVTVPSSISWDLALYKNRNLELPNLFRLMSDIVEVIGPKVNSIDIDTALCFLPKVEKSVSDLSLCTSDVYRINTEMLRMHIENKQSFMMSTCSVEDGASYDDLSLNAVLAIQSPQVNFGSSNSSRVILYRDESLLRQVIKRKINRELMTLSVNNSILYNNKLFDTPSSSNIFKNEKLPSSGTKSSRRSSLIPTAVTFKSHMPSRRQNLAIIKEASVGKTKSSQKENVTPCKRSVRSNFKVVNKKWFPDEVGHPSAAPVLCKIENGNSKTDVFGRNGMLPDLSTITMTPDKTFESPLARFMDSPLASTSENSEEDSSNVCSPSGKINVGGRTGLRPSIDRLISRFQEIKIRSQK